MLGTFDQVCEGGVLQNLRCGIADVEEHLIQGAMMDIPADEAAQLLGIGKGGKRSIHQPHNFGESNLSGRPA